MEKVNDVYLALGSNLGDPKQNIIQCIAFIEKKVGRVCKKGRLYSNQAIGFSSDSLFLNTVLKVQSQLTPDELLLACKSIEEEMGRQPKTGNTYTSRIIDIDIILFNMLIYNKEELNIPHLESTKRDFVLLPLGDIDQNLVFPHTKLTVYQHIELLSGARQLSTIDF